MYSVSPCVPNIPVYCVSPCVTMQAFSSVWRHSCVQCQSICFKHICLQCQSMCCKHICLLCQSMRYNAGFFFSVEMELSTMSVPSVTMPGLCCCRFPSPIPSSAWRRCCPCACPATASSCRAWTSTTTSRASSLGPCTLRSHHSSEPTQTLCLRRLRKMLDFRATIARSPCSCGHFVKQLRRIQREWSFSAAVP